MGLFDKLFGGKQPEASSQPNPAQINSATEPTPEAAVPARRERTKPQAMVPTNPSAADAPTISPDAENAALLIAIHGIVSGDNAQSRADLYAAILQSTIYLVSMPSAEEEVVSDEELGAGEITLKEGQKLSLATIRDPEGRTFLPAFTDVERLSQSLPDKGRYVRLAATSVCQMFLQGGGEGIVINPGQPPSGVITRAEAELLAAGAMPVINADGQLSAQVAQQMKIVIGKPEVAPAETFVQAIRAESVKQPIVREAHLFKAGVGEQPPRLMIGLLADAGLTPESMHPAFEAIGKAAYEARGETEAFDMMPLNDQMLEAIRSLESVIYSRDQEV